MTKPKKTGRPKGAQTQRFDTVTESVDPCPKCGSHDREAKRPFKTVRSSGKLYSWWYTSCRTCGKRYLIRRVTNDPSSDGPDRAA
jgi:hypothetical protein